jgi:uncharacterized protein (DUF849 family)
MSKLIISACLLGAGTMRSATPYVPIPPDEIAEDVVRCAKAGAAIVHIHARDDEGKNTMATDRFVEIYDKSTAACRKPALTLCLTLPPPAPNSHRDAPGAPEAFKA